MDYTIGYRAERQLAGISDESNDEARRRMTTLSVGRRVAASVLSCAGIGIVRSRIRGLEALSYALTRPARIGDAVRFTYLVIRT